MAEREASAPTACSVDYDPFAAVEKELPTTPAQREMWRFSRRHPENACAYNDGVVLQLVGTVDERALAAALQSLADFHEALRGRLANDGQLLLLPAAAIVPIARHDLSRLPPASRAEALTALLTAESRTPFDLEAGPLFRCAFVYLGGDQAAVVLAVHRAICDGWSLDVLLYDLGRLYSAFCGVAPLPAPPVHSFSDYLAHRNSPEFVSRTRSSLGFWRAAAASAPRPRKQPVSRVAGAVSHAERALPPDLVGTAREFARSNGLSFFSLLLSVAGRVLRRAGGDEDPTIAVPVAGQPDSAMDDCVGQLAATVPVRLRFAADGTFRQLVSEVGRAMLDARENAAVDLCELGGGQDECGEASAPDALFTHVQKYPPGKLRFGDCVVEYSFLRRHVEVFAVGFTVLEGRDSVRLSGFVASEVGDGSWLRSRLDDFEQLLRSGCESPDRPIG